MSGYGGKAMRCASRAVARSGCSHCGVGNRIGHCPARRSLKNRTCPQATEWGDTHHRVWVSPSGSANGLRWSEAGGLETCLRPWVMHHQHSRDARNDCVKFAPRWAQVSGPVDRVSAFPYRLKVTHG